MKLSNQQIRALATQLTIEQNKKQLPLIKAAEKKLENAAQKEAMNLLKIINKIPLEIRRILYSDMSPSLKSLTKKLQKNHGIPTYSVSDMEDKIIVASIEANTIEELKRKLKIK